MDNGDLPEESVEDDNKTLKDILESDLVTGISDINKLLNGLLLSLIQNENNLNILIDYTKTILKPNTSHFIRIFDGKEHKITYEFFFTENHVLTSTITQIKLQMSETIRTLNQNEMISNILGFVSDNSIGKLRIVIIEGKAP